jgi:hypothetical protein
MNEKDWKQLNAASFASRGLEIESAHDCRATQLQTLSLEGYERFFAEYCHIRFHKFGELFFPWGLLN